MSLGSGEQDNGATGSVSTAAITVNVRAANIGTIALGCGLAGAIGIVSVVSAFTGDVEGGTGERIAAFVIGSIFTLIGVAPLLMWRIVFRPRRLVLEPAEIRWDDPKGKPWRLAWPELSAVKISMKQRARSVTLILEPADAERFRTRHPEMEHLAKGSAGSEYRVPLGPVLRLVAPIERGLRSFAPDLYDGTEVTGVVPNVPGRPPPVPIRVPRSSDEVDDAPSRREAWSSEESSSSVVGVPSGQASGSSEALREIPTAPNRPWAVQVAVLLVVAYWVGVITYAAVTWSAWDLGQTGMAAFWSLIVAAWLWRVWQGGAIAISRMQWLATALGLVSLVGVVLLSATLMMSGFSSGWGMVPGLVMGGALLAVGLLLRRNDVRHWSDVRALGG